MEKPTRIATPGHCAAVAMLAIAAASLLSAEVFPDEPAAGPIEGPDQVFISRALALASDKLHNPVCRQVFAEFNAVGGASLDEVLRAHGETADVHLRRIRFRDGSRHLRCIKQEARAVTRTGSLDVLLCGSFLTEARRDPSAAANVLIHEELHSLGAGEAPMPGFPSSEEITALVGRRCGR